MAGFFKKVKVATNLTAPSDENSPSKTLERQDSLEVPELQDDPKDEGNEDEDESTRKSKAILNFMTAVKVARWVARAYGYVTMKKAAYLRPEVFTYSESITCCECDLSILFTS